MATVSANLHVVLARCKISALTVSMSGVELQTRDSLPGRAGGRGESSGGLQGGCNVIRDNEPHGTVASSCNRCKKEPDWHRSRLALPPRGARYFEGDPKAGNSAHLKCVFFMHIDQLYSL